MVYKLIITPEAFREIDLAICYFKTKNIEKACLKELSEQITFLEEHPLTRQIRYKNIRIHLFKKFNYSFHYVVIDNEVRILHFLNQKQNF